MGFRFSRQSRVHLDTCHKDLQAIAEKAIEIMDFKITCGHRGESMQNLLFGLGKSTKQWPHGRHNSMPSEAVDLVPYPVDYEDEDRFLVLAGVIKAVAHFLGIGIRWGGDWDMDGLTTDERFRDLGHFELLKRH
jgi:hypothetical protein